MKLPGLTPGVSGASPAKIFALRKIGRVYCLWPNFTATFLKTYLSRRDPAKGGDIPDLTVGVFFGQTIKKPRGVDGSTKQVPILRLGGDKTRLCARLHIAMGPSLRCSRFRSRTNPRKPLCP